jgi:tetratricopeptide (TPR) repeat protein
MAAPAVAGACPECGTGNASDHNYCKHCGQPLREVAVERELGTGFAERTRDRCLSLLKADPDNASAHYNLGLAYYHLGQTGNAIRCFERTIELEDAYPGAHFQLGVAHYKRGAMAECAAASRKAIELNPKSAPAHFRLALALFHLGRLDEAAGAFEATVATDPEYVIACYHLGIVRERLDDVDGAIECFERVVVANPHDASAHYHLGLGYKHKGLDAIAMSTLAEALRLDPDDTAAAQELQDLQR